MRCRTLEPVASLSSSRIGSPPISVQTIIDRHHRKGGDEARRRGFEEAVTKTAVEVTVADALSAAQRLQKREAKGKYTQGAAMGAVAVPVVKAIGRAVEGAAKTPGGVRARVAGAGKNVISVSGPELLRSATEGAIGGGALKALSDTAERRRDRKVLDQYLRKTASLMATAPVSAAAGSAASRATSIGRFRGFSTQNSLKPPGPISAGVVDPARSIKSSVAVPR